MTMDFIDPHLFLLHQYTPLRWGCSSIHDHWRLLVYQAINHIHSDISWHTSFLLIFLSLCLSLNLCFSPLYLFIALFFSPFLSLSPLSLCLSLPLYFSLSVSIDVSLSLPVCPLFCLAVSNSEAPFFPNQMNDLCNPGVG